MSKYTKLSLTDSLPDERGVAFESRNSEFKFNAFIPDAFNDDKEWHLYTNDKETVLVVQVMSGEIMGSAIYTMNLIDQILGWVSVPHQFSTYKKCFECANGERDDVEADYEITGYDHEFKLPIRGCVCAECLGFYDTGWGKETKTIKPISYLARTGVLA